MCRGSGRFRDSAVTAAHNASLSVDDEEPRTRMSTATEQADPHERSGRGSGRSTPTGQDGHRSDGLLVRIPAHDDGWLDRLPPAPGSEEVTVSLTDPSAAIRHAARLIRMGYTPVGSAGAGADRRWADIVASRALLDSEPAWRERLLTDGCRVYASAHGPVRALLGGILSAHDREATGGPQ